MNYDIKGISQVVAEIKKLDDKLKRRELLKILRRQSKPVLRAIKQNTPVYDYDVIRTRKSDGKQFTYEPGNLKKSMAIKTGKSKTKPTVMIGPRQGERAKYDGYYAFFIQYGTFNQSPNDFIAKAAEPLIGTVATSASAETKRYLEKKIKELQL